MRGNSELLRDSYLKRLTGQLVMPTFKRSPPELLHILPSTQATFFPDHNQHDLGCDTANTSGTSKLLDGS